MSKRREYKNLPATDAPQQKPGTRKQAKATKQQLESKLMAPPDHMSPKHKHHDAPGSKGPELIDDIEIP